MSDSLPAGAIPVDQFQAAETPAAAPNSAAMPSGLPPGAIPVDQFESQDQADEKYGSLGQQAIAGLEGAARGVVGPVAPYVEKHVLGVPQEDIESRDRVNPWTSGVTEGGGLVASALLGTGLGSALTHVGQAAEAVSGLGKVSEAAKLMTAAKAAAKAGTAEAPALMEAAETAAQGVSYAHKVGSAAVKSAAEMMALQASDEASKYVVTDVDPATAAETAIGHIGLAGALGLVGGGFMTGAVSPLWGATVGPKVESAIMAMTDKFGGVAEGKIDQAMAQRASQQLEAESGIVLPKDIKNVLDDTPMAKTTHSILTQTDNIVGRSYQKQVQDVESQAADKVLGSLGRDASSIERMPEVDKYSTGRDIGETLADKFEEQAKPITARYDAINEQFSDAPISHNTKGMIADQIAQASMEQGWQKASDETSSKIMEKVMNKLPGQETVADLKNEITNLRNAHPYNSPGYNTAKTIIKALNSGLEDGIAENMGIKQGAEKVAEYGQLRSDYRQLMQQAEALNEHLHVGRYQGPQSFVQAIREMSSANGEGVLNRLSGKNKADALTQLAKYPEVLDKVKNYHIDNIIDQAIKKAPTGKPISMQKLLDGVQGAKPQIKQLIANDEQHKVINAAGKILEGLKDPTHNFSNSAPTMVKLMHGTPSVLSLLAMLTGHGEVGIATYLGNLVGGNAKDGAKLALTRLLASDKPANAAGFRALMSFANSAVKGEKVINQSVANVFKPGARVLMDTQVPTHAELMQLDKAVTKNSDNPEAELHKQDSQLGHYMPNHQVAATAAVAAGQQYLATLKPHPYQPSPLDRPIAPTPQQQLRYERALTIAQQPAIVMQHIKDGTLQPSDIQDLHNIYPSLYKQYANKLSQQMTNRHADEEPIPYKTRMGISLFLGQPIDSSMTPASINAAQPKPTPPPPQQPGQKGGKSMKSLGKSNKSYQTQSQDAESDRQTRD